MLDGLVLENQVGKMSRKSLFIFLNTLKVAGLHNCSTVNVKSNKYINTLINLLYNEGYINGFFFKDKYTIVIYLKYYNGYFLLRNLKIYGSNVKPYYIKYKELLRMYKGPLEVNYFLLINTSYGLLTFEEIFLKNYHVGGEVIFSINLI